MTKVIPLHFYPMFYEPCADMLNEEWPRSTENRLHTLKKSCDELPCSLIFVTDINENNACLIGHSRLCSVVGIPQACLVESVVVQKSLRGQGYGRELMDATETYAKQRGFSVMFLTTHDKQKFYAHLGYRTCDPVVSLGSNGTSFTQKIVESLFGKGCIGSVSNDRTVNKQEQSPAMLSTSQTSTTPISSISTTSTSSLSGLELPQSSPPPPPPPPPPPLPPRPLVPPSSISGTPPCSNQPYRSTNQMKVVRMDPSLVSWMTKAL